MDDLNLNPPLVSILIVTYNSSEYVVQTLESAKSQSYQNIELIVTDDGSKDDTVNICRKWIERNKNRFVHTNLITSTVNTGIAPNLNRGLQHTNGEWVKCIAGDDILFPSSIETFCDYIKENKHKKDLYFLFGGCCFIIDDKIDDDMQIPSPDFQNKNAYEQYISLITNGNNIHGPTMLFNLEKIKELGYFDESIPLSEDWPLYIKATKNNCKLYFVNKTIAGYRLHEGGIFSKTKIGFKYDTRLREDVNLVRKKYIIPNLLNEKLYKHAFHNWIIYKKENHKNKFIQFIFKSLLILSPLHYENMAARKQEMAD